MTPHLSHEQLCDLVAADLSSQHEATGFAVTQEHLRACAACAAELRTLRDSLADFREASIAFSRQQFAQTTHLRWASIAPPPHRYLSQPLYWAAAVLTLVAALFPLSMRHGGPVHSTAPSTAQIALGAPANTSAQSTESDEELLADIDQKVNADIPSPLEPLANPAATTTETSASSDSSDQRTN